MKQLLTLATMLAIVTPSLPTLAQTDLQEYVDSFRSVNQVKEEIRQLMEVREQCAVGSCWNSTSTSICEVVAALDVKVNGQIVGQMFSGEEGSPGEIPISQDDLQLMKLIFSQCQPSNYQYWNWDRMLHVLYSPSPEAEQKIRSILKLPPSQ